MAGPLSYAADMRIIRMVAASPRRRAHHRAFPFLKEDGAV
jgi:hypothetical protein